MHISKRTGFIPAIRSYCAPDNEDFLTFRNYNTGAVQARINPQSQQHGTTTMQHLGYILTSTLDGKVWGHTISSAYGFLTSSRRFTTPSPLKAFRVACNGDEKYSFVVFGEQNCLAIVTLESDQSFGSKTLVAMGPQPLRKIEVVFTEAYFMVYALFDVRDPFEGEVKIYKVELGQQKSYSTPLRGLLNVFDICAVNNQQISTLTRSKDGKTFALDGVDTTILVYIQCANICAPVTVVDMRTTVEGVQRSSETVPGFIHENEYECRTAFLWNGKMYSTFHKAMETKLIHEHQEIVVSDYTIHQTLYSINEFSNLESRKFSIALFPEDDQEKVIVASVGKVFNRQGQLDLFFESPLRTVLKRERDFDTLEESTYLMFKFLVSQHLEIFSKSLFQKDNKDLNSHSNFERYNQSLLKYTKELQEELLHKLRGVEGASSLPQLLRRAQNGLHFARSMHLKVECQHQRYQRFRSTITRKQGRYSSSVAKYRDTRNLAQSLVYILQSLNQEDTQFLPSSMRIQKAITTRIEAIVRLEAHRKGSSRSEPVYIEQFFKQFESGYWTAPIAPFPAFDFYRKILCSHPLELLYVMLPALRQSSLPTKYFGINREELDTVEAMIKLEDQALSREVHLQCLDQLINTTCAVPNYFYLYLAKAALDREFSTLAVRILNSYKLELSSNNLHDFIDIHIRAQKVQLCYLQIKDFLGGVIGEECGKVSEDFQPKEAIKLLIQRCLQKGGIMEIVRLAPALKNDEKQILQSELNRRNIKIKINDYLIQGTA